MNKTICPPDCWCPLKDDPRPCDYLRELKEAERLINESKKTE